MINKNTIFLALLIIAMQTQGLEMQASIINNSLSLTIRDIDYPSRLLQQELTSGLPNKIDVLVEVKNGENSLLGFVKNYTIIYDLWDEQFNVTESSGHLDSFKLSSTKTINDMLSTLVINDILSLDRLDSSRKYLISAQVAFNPVREERIQKIKEWTATSKGFTVDPDTVESQSKLLAANGNSASDRSNAIITGGAIGPGESPTSAIGSNTGVVTEPSSGPRFQKLFDRILDQYLDSEDVVAQWRSKKIEKTFTVDELNAEQ